MASTTSNDDATVAPSPANPFENVLKESNSNNTVRTTTIIRRKKGAGPPLSQSALFDAVDVTSESDSSRSYDDDEIESDDGADSGTKSTKTTRQKPPRPSIAQQQHRRSSVARRRSSTGRFLQFGSGNRRRSSIRKSCINNNTTENNDDLSELYQKAIKMNAENKINAGNSWNLRLIENIDNFLESTEESVPSSKSGSISISDRNTSNTNDGTPATEVDDNNNKKKRVNFTKASCTLDASVKIYSYRVDDVHLTSYKVLANLNRTNNTNGTKSNTDDDEGEDGQQQQQQPRRSKKKTNTSGHTTIESHIANLNLNKLDSAFDIDPLFHKMSKSFDEGGAKGLLLVNLGVGDSGCNIVFDSSSNEAATMPDHPRGDSNLQLARIEEGMMDISALTEKLTNTLEEEHETNNLDTVPLVPQLMSLRAEHEELDRNGFVDDNAVQISSAMPVGPKTPGKRRYHAGDSEEREAARTIHKEARERSRISVGQNLALRFDSPVASTDGFVDDDDDGPINFTNGDYDDGDDDDDGFDTFIAADDHGRRYSAVSFGSTTNDIAIVDSEAYGESETTNILNAIASGETSLVESDYTYFHATSMGGNLWAGAAHWKRPSSRKSDNAATKKRKVPAKRRPTNKKSSGTTVSYSLDDSPPDLSSLFSKPKRKLAIQLSKTMISKHTNELNLLPEDAEYKTEQLFQLFLRPKSSVINKTNANVTVSFSEEPNNDEEGRQRTVEFEIPTTWDNNGSFGGNDNDNDGPGFNFGGEDHDDDEEYMIHELEGVRKVNKIQVGYASVAKKVDVKRLKRDLWEELEKTFNHNEVSDDISLSSDNDGDNCNKYVSFQDAVTDLENQKSQMDVTLPFYFICILHLANERNLRLESSGCLNNFIIHSE